MEKTDIAKAKAIAFIKNNMLLTFGGHMLIKEVSKINLNIDLNIDSKNVTFGFKLKKKEKKHEEN